MHQVFCLTICYLIKNLFLYSCALEVKYCIEHNSKSHCTRPTIFCINHDLEIRELQILLIMICDELCIMGMGKIPGKKCRQNKARS